MQTVATPPNDGKCSTVFGKNMASSATSTSDTPVATYIAILMSMIFSKCSDDAATIAKGKRRGRRDLVCSHRAIELRAKAFRSASLRAFHDYH
jgi:hypothetical protein